MRTKLCATLLGICLMQSITAQAPSGSMLSTTEPHRSAAEQKAIEYFLQHHPNASAADHEEFTRSLKRSVFASQSNSSQRLAQPPSPQASCTNIDFEQGNLNGWTSSTGFNPGYNATGSAPRRAARRLS